MLVETVVTDITTSLILKGKVTSLTLHEFTPGAEEQAGALQPAGMPKAEGKPGTDLKPANLKSATMDGCCCRAALKASVFSGL